MLYVDESGKFADSEDDVAIAGLLVSDDLPGLAPSEVKRSLEAAVPGFPWPWHAGLLNNASWMALVLADGRIPANHADPDVRWLADAVRRVNDRFEAHDPSSYGAIRQRLLTGNAGGVDLGDLATFDVLLRNECPTELDALRAHARRAWVAVKDFSAGLAQRAQQTGDAPLAVLLCSSETVRADAIGSPESELGDRRYFKLLEVLVDRCSGLLTRRGGLHELRLDLSERMLIDPALRRRTKMIPLYVTRELSSVIAKWKDSVRIVPAAVTPFDSHVGMRFVVTDFAANRGRRFAQVEEDLQQVNLTRFSLFFPEKRDFFLEGQSIFAFGGASIDGRNGGGVIRDIPILFFSRQIGLNRGQAVPVIAGGRLTGRVNGYTLGLINVETDDKPEALATKTNFTAMTVRRNILRRSSIGVLATRRAAIGEPEKLTSGLDANMQFFQNISLVGYFAQTNPNVAGKSDISYRGRFDYTGDRYGLETEHINVGDGFNPAVGFARRLDFTRDYAQARFSPRTRRSKLVRWLVWEAGVDYIENSARTTVMNRDLYGNFDVEFNSSDVLHFEHNRNYEFIPSRFEIAPGVIVPVGGYDFQSTRASYNLGLQHKVSGTVAASTGTLYGGTRREASYSGYTSLNKFLAFEPSFNLAWVDIPGGEFTARVVTVRTIVTPTPRMMFSSLVQFNNSSHSLTSSARMRWEYTPGSEFFIVYSDGRNTLTRGMPELLNHSIAVKITKLFRF